MSTAGKPPRYTVEVEPWKSLRAPTSGRSASGARSFKGRIGSIVRRVLLAGMGNRNSNGCSTPGVNEREGRRAVLLILWFVLGPLLLLATLVAADARGGLRLRERVHTDPENGVRYVVVLALGVIFVGLMATFGVG